MNVKLPIVTLLLALLVVPTLAHSLSQRLTVDEHASGAQATVVESTAPSAIITQSNPAQAGAQPARGMTMAQVESRFGIPDVRRAPVGNPPITRWEYPSFVVYFEYRHVIHSVNKVSR
ncbi:MAG: phosphodiesterase [Pseudomonadota bacterium]